MTKRATRLFAAQIEPYLNALFASAYRLTGNAADAEDLVQETCLKAFVEIERFGKSASPKNWLMRVQYHLFVDDKRHVEHQRLRRMEPAETARLAADESANPEFCAGEMQAEAQLMRAWEKLSRDQRAILGMRVEGFSLAEICEITGMSVSVLGARLHRARQSLGRHLRNSETVELPPTRMEQR